MKARSSSKMCNKTLLKQEFLKKWIKGLHIYNNFNKANMSISDRKNAIKLSADVAIASTRKTGTQWSKALINDVVSKDHGNNPTLVEKILGHKVDQKNNKASTNGLVITCSKRILRKNHVARRRKARRVVPRCVKSSSVTARKLVKNRTRVLKSLVPGGEKMEESCLIQETLDYIVSLRAQVDVMRLLACAAERLEG